MSDLRDLLDAEARRVSAEPGAMDAVLRRAGRRRRNRRVATGALALMIAAGGTYGAYRAFRPGARIEPGEAAIGGPEVFPGIWPESSEEELAEAQRAVDQGHQPWRLDPVETAKAFAVNLMGWEPEKVRGQILGSDDPEALLVEVRNTEASLVEPVSEFVVLRQLGRRGPEGIWSVTRADSLLIALDSPTPDQEAQPGTVVRFSGSVRLDFADVRMSLDFQPEGGGRLRTPATGSHFSGGLGVPDDVDPWPVAMVKIFAADARALGVTAFRMGAGPFPPSDEALPASVADTRETILKAASQNDFEALRRLIDPENFTYSFGESGDPIGYWKGLYVGHEDAPLVYLQTVLSAPWAKSEGIYAWPSIYATDPSEWTEEELEPLREIATPEDIRRWREFGGYTGYRVGIEPDGDWIFFVAGD